MKWIWLASEFVRKVRYQMRFGELSRAPLKLLRLELRDGCAECEWLARRKDPWDRDLPMEVQERNETDQALHDAIRVRELLFSSIPQISSASLKVYRQRERQLPELIITGSVSREDAPPPRVASLVMRAKLYGLYFYVVDQALASLDIKDNDFELATEASCD